MTTPAPSPRREWTPRLWHGIDSLAWMRLCWRNGFLINPRYSYIAAITTLVSIGHTALRVVHDALFGPAIERTVIRQAPIFIVGHWRTGTTLMHELLIRDPRHSFPDWYHCLDPNHPILTEWLIKGYFQWMMPSRRPMDGMAAGWDRPQEDEFALCMLGQPSPYLMLAFPNNPPIDQDAFDIGRLPRRQRESWKKTFVRYLKMLTYKDPRRLVLKSPTHSCRIPTLLELFPDALFVHIVRDPYVVFPSTVNLWRSLYEAHGLQKPRFNGLEEYVFRTFTHLYDSLEAGKKVIPPGRFYEVRYEDLIADPLGKMEQMYATLNLGGFDDVKPRLEQYLRDNAGYQTNKYRELEPTLRAEITRRWGEVIRRYGYG